MKTLSAVNLNIRLEAATRKDGSAWLAWCPPLDIVTQALTRQEALKSLEQAVYVWIESCLDRGVLDKALEEVGFRKVRRGKPIPTRASMGRLRPGKTGFSKNGYVEVSVPAYIAAQQLQPRASS